MLRIVKSLIATAALASPAAAGWDNVFQLTCCDGPQTRASFSPPVATGESCEPQARVSYIQRCFLQPETSYKKESYYVPVKENVKSYYYEPVTSYKYVSNYDPCTGCCQQVAVPTTSYAIKEKCNSVTRWVEQSRMVPVTSYRQVTSYTPVVTYYYPPVSSPSSFKIPVAPRVDEQRNVAPAPETDLIPKTDLKTTPNSIPRTMPKSTSSSAAYTASRSKGAIRGELVANDKTTPRPNTKVIFLNAADTSKREEATTNGFGEFDVKLPAGEWYVYLGQGTGKATFHKKLTVSADDNRDVTLVSR